MGNNPISLTDLDWGTDCEGCPDAGFPWSNSAIELDAVTIGSGKPSTAEIYASMTLVLTRTSQIGACLIGNDLSGIGVGDDWLIPIVGIAGIATLKYIGSELPPTVKPTFSEVAASGVISSTAGAAAYRPERPKMLDFNDLMAANVTMQQTIHLYITYYEHGTIRTMFHFF